MTGAKVGMGEDDTTLWFTPNTIRVPELLIYISTALVQSGVFPSICQTPS